MKEQIGQNKGLLDHFRLIPDPRIEKKCKHKLIDMIAIAISAILCGADDWNAIESFGRAKADWFETFLELPYGIPSHDTFRRLFSMLSPQAFQDCFTQWVRDVAGLIEGVIAIDGKTVRRSHDRQLGKKAIHIVSAWSAENRLVLGQVKTDEKSNEITAIPELLKVLALKGCIVTIDAMGCQKAIAKQIIEAEGDYLLALKGNQSTLAEQVEHVFAKADKAGYRDYDVDFYETTERNRDRFEIRRHWTLGIANAMIDVHAWRGLNIIAMVESQRTIKNETSVEYRYYISSIENDAKRFADSVRVHWGIENSLHWQLDMSFREDESRMRNAHSAENFVVMRHVALNLLKNDKTVKLGVKNKRLRAGWDKNYLANLLLSA